MNSRLKNLYTLAAAARTWQILAILVLSGGIFLRLIIWLQARPIFLDEANLIRNYEERTYTALFQNLEYEQYAPPLFSVIVKAGIDLLGNNELTTRIFPLVCSIVTLFLFYSLCRRFLNLPATVAALAFVAFGKIFIDYATECKQYATDGLITLLLLELFFRLRPPNGISKITFTWVLIGAISVWFSMPAVFVLAGIGFFWLVQSWQTQNKNLAWGSVVAGVCWFISFMVYFWLLLLHNAQSDYLQNFHNEYFLAFPPKNLTDLQLLGTQAGRIVSKAIGKTTIAKILTGIALVAALRKIIIGRKEPNYQLIFWLLLMPIIFCLAASAFRYYSLLTRLTLFFLPLLILLVFLGLQSLARNRFTAGLISAWVLVVLANQEYFTEMNKPFHSDYPEAREALKFVSANQKKGEPIIVADGVLPVARYYMQHHETPIPLHHIELKKLGYGISPDSKLDSLRRLGYKNVWLVASAHDKEFDAFATEHQQITKRKDDHFSYAILYKIQ